MINNDTETLGGLSGDTGLLDLGEGETSTEPDLGVVSDRGGSDGGSEELKGSDTQGQGLGLSGDPSPVLSAGLVEPGLDPFLWEAQSCLAAASELTTPLSWSVCPSIPAFSLTCPCHPSPISLACQTSSCSSISEFDTYLPVLSEVTGLGEGVVVLDHLSVAISVRTVSRVST